MNGTIIYLFGFAGCGKLTIAKAIQLKLDCILVDNHRINNVIFSLIDPDGKSRLPSRVWKNVGVVRAAVFDTIRHLSKPGRNFIFTNELLQGDEGARKVFLEIAELAKERHALFLPVRLLISPDELARRVGSPGRAENFKETNPQDALEKAQQMEVFKPDGFAYLELDITSITPEEAAKQIIAELPDREQ